MVKFQEIKGEKRAKIFVHTVNMLRLIQLWIQREESYWFVEKILILLIDVSIVNSQICLPVHKCNIGFGP